MNFKNQKRLLFLGTVLTLIITSAVFTYFIHSNNEQIKAELIENKLKGDAKSILPHLYQSGNFAWFTDNLEQYKKLGLPCLSVKDTTNSIIWGQDAKCKNTIDAKNYIDQTVFKINYDLPEVTVFSTIKTNGASFSIFFIIQFFFLTLAYKFLAIVNKRHSETLVQI